ncbi:GNAT family N-acetyltransferase [Novosphingobium sp. PhB165]|uniref:GNAT family N-acetyltransferase n=1 Tax=Novosphingobium sp. PhB165 TaxID=2485105 RepID=UPI00104AFEF6|nr:GNAT family N-acetyltransferase [Novosphingobium sp. PhB165]
MSPVLIRPFVPSDEQGVIDVILPIQREEFGIAISADDQPDLRAIPAWYQTGAGEFLVAEHEGRIVGTIAMKDIGAGQGALRKMFVAADYRGREFGTANALLARLLEISRAAGIREVFLGTTDKFLAAHRFYERHGFHRVEPQELPESFPRMAVDTRFYVLVLAEE